MGSLTVVCGKLSIWENKQTVVGGGGLKGGGGGVRVEEKPLYFTVVFFCRVGEGDTNLVLMLALSGSWPERIVNTAFPQHLKSILQQDA